MGKRTQRIYSKEIFEKSAHLVGREANVVLWSGETYFGNIVAIHAQALSLIGKGTFWYSKKRNTHLIPFEKIQELNIEIVSEH